MSHTDKWGRALSIILLIVILGTIGTMIYVIVTPKEVDKYTEFYVLGPQGEAENYPAEVMVADLSELEEEYIGKVILGIVNQEHETTSYDIKVWIDEAPIKVGLISIDDNGNEEVERIVDKIEIGSLSQGEKWEQKIGFAGLESSISTKLIEPSNSATLINSTELSETATQGQTALAVTKTDGFEVNDYVLIGDADDDNVEFVRIEDIDINGSEITLSTGLRYIHNQGDAIWRQTLLKVDKTDDFKVGDYLQIGSSDDNNVEFVQIEDIDNNESEITLSTGLKYVHYEGEEVIERQRVGFRLFKNEESEPYLTLHLYVIIIEAVL